MPFKHQYFFRKILADNFPIFELENCEKTNSNKFNFGDFHYRLIMFEAMCFFRLT